MQAWCAEENSLKTLKILLFKNFWLVMYTLFFLIFSKLNYTGNPIVKVKVTIGLYTSSY